MLKLPFCSALLYHLAPDLNQSLLSVWSLFMQHENEVNDPFSWGYVAAALLVLLALPLMNAIIGWFVYYL
jgi:hypothetical protein